jgi:hypothetical protein
LYKPDDNTLGSNERYAFKGWKSEKQYNENIANPDLYDLSKLVITSDMNLYAHYEIEDATKVASNLRLFEITNTKPQSVGGKSY